MIPSAYVIAEVAGLIGDVTRAKILGVLMDGRARTASELTCHAGVTAQTTSEHLGKLTETGLLALETQGRHRYYRLAGPAVAYAVEAIVTLAARGPASDRAPSRHDQALRLARTCYDHLAGRLGVAVTEALVTRGYVASIDRAFRLTAKGEAFLRDLGVDIDGARRRRLAFARACLDWSERRPHLAGALGAALTGRCLELGLVERVPGCRSLSVTDRGRRAFHDLFGIDLCPSGENMGPKL